VIADGLALRPRGATAAASRRGERAASSVARWGPVVRPVHGVLRQHRRDQVVQLRRHLRPQRADARRVTEQDLSEGAGGAVALERGRPGQALEQHAAEREHVGARVDRAAVAHLLGRHEAGRADHRAGLRELCAARAPRDPEVEDLDVVDAAGGEEQVAGLEIAVHGAERVGGAERLADPDGERERLADGERLAREAAVEVLAVEPLHDEVELARGRLAVGDVADDAGVREPGEQLHLAREARDAGAPDVGEDLDGDRVARGAITGAEDLPHAAGAHLLLNLEPAAQQLPELHGPI
jgi:hypothetical protein